MKDYRHLGPCLVCREFIEINDKLKCRHCQVNQNQVKILKEALSKQKKRKLISIKHFLTALVKSSNQLISRKTV